MSHEQRCSKAFGFAATTPRCEYQSLTACPFSSWRPVSRELSWPTSSSLHETWRSSQKNPTPHPARIPLLHSRQSKCPVQANRGRWPCLQPGIHPTLLPHPSLPGRDRHRWGRMVAILAYGGLNTRYDLGRPAWQYEWESQGRHTPVWLAQGH